MTTVVALPANSQPIDATTGLFNLPWYLFFNNIVQAISTGGSTVTLEDVLTLVTNQPQYTAQISEIYNSIQALNIDVANLPIERIKAEISNINQQIANLFLLMANVDNKSSDINELQHTTHDLIVLLANQKNYLARISQLEQEISYIRAFLAI